MLDWKSGLNHFCWKTLHPLRQEGGTTMPKTKHHRIAPAVPCPNRPLATASLIFFTLLLTAGTLHAQLPAGTTDTTRPQQQKQDPLLTQANEALDKHDYA